MTRWRLAFLLLLPASAAAQQPSEPPNSLLLIAKPELVDPNFRQTVVLVTQTPDAHTVGVILNRPTKVKLSQLLPEGAPAGNYRDAVYLGGPVMPQALVALFRAAEAPRAPAFHVLKSVYLSMHPAIIEPLLAGTAGRYRLYVGFSGWAPRQLESELARDDWYLLPASEELVFRKDTRNMWKELLEKAARRRNQAATYFLAASATVRLYSAR
jgi:putative transcriptional regulator